MNRNSFIIPLLIMVIYSCTKPKATSDRVQISPKIAELEFYQKEIPYDGFQESHVDSVISTTYEINDGTQGEIVNIEIKRYNDEGYIVSNENKTYEFGELTSAGQISYTRDQKSLVTSQLTNFLTNRGIGYTKQYNLVRREMNNEIWEYISKTPDKALELTAEIRKFSDTGMKIFAQIGTGDSTSLKMEYIYQSAGLVSDIYYYESGDTTNHIHTVYNECNFPSATLLKDYFAGKTSDNFQYIYDNKNNPIEIRVYRGEKLIGIIENKIFYRNRI